MIDDINTEQYPCRQSQIHVYLLYSSCHSALVSASHLCTLSAIVTKPKTELEIRFNELKLRSFGSASNGASATKTRTAGIRQIRNGLVLYLKATMTTSRQLAELEDPYCKSDCEGNVDVSLY